MSKDSGEGQEQRRDDEAKGVFGTRFYKRPYTVEQPKGAKKAGYRARPKPDRLRKFQEAFRENPVTFATWALVAVTFLGTLGLLRQQHSDDVATLRPYIGFTGATITIGNGTFFGKVYWHNFGKTPAIKIQPAAELIAKDNGTEQDIPTMIQTVVRQMKNDYPGRRDFDIAVAPGQSTYTASRLYPATPIEIDDLAHVYRWVLVGRITYEDEFGGKYVSETCYYQTPADQYHFCQTYNGMH